LRRFVARYSGATARDSHPLPYSPRSCGALVHGVFRNTPERSKNRRQSGDVFPNVNTLGYTRTLSVQNHAPAGPGAPEGAVPGKWAKVTRQMTLRICGGVKSWSGRASDSPPGPQVEGGTERLSYERNYKGRSRVPKSGPASRRPGFQDPGSVQFTDRRSLFGNRPNARGWVRVPGLRGCRPASRSPADRSLKRPGTSGRFYEQQTAVRLRCPHPGEGDPESGRARKPAKAAMTARVLTPE
jgi:hypothetical protein